MVPRSRWFRSAAAIPASGSRSRALKNNVPIGLDLFWTASPGALVHDGSLIKFDWVKEFGLAANLR